MTERIMRYLDGAMSEEEKKTFEQELQENDDLKKEVALHAKVDDFLVEVNEIEDLKDLVRETHTEYIKRNESDTIISNVYWKIGIAASILLIIGSVFWFAYYSKTSSYIFKQNYQAWNFDKTLRGDSDVKAYKAWDKMYEDKKYAELIFLYTGLPHEIKTDVTISFMYASALMEIEKFQSSIEVLNSINVTNNAFLLADVLWYKGLCYLKLDNYTEAKKAFSELTEDSKYKDKAQRILKKISKK